MVIDVVEVQKITFPAVEEIAVLIPPVFVIIIGIFVYWSTENIVFGISAETTEQYAFMFLGMFMGSFRTNEHEEFLPVSTV